MYAQCRQLQILIQLFNEGFASHIFAMKIGAISTCIILFSFGIHLVHEHTKAWMYLITAFDLGATFPALFDKGYAIPRQIDRLKRVVLSMKVKRNCSGRYHRGCIAKLFKSIPNLGIKVGSFHQLERMSTLKFLGFVTVNVVRVLIFLKKY